jgi:outer membrane protein TolC
LVSCACFALAAGALGAAPDPSGEGDVAAEAPIVPAQLSLERAVEIALAYNPEVAASAEGVNASRGLLTQAMSYLGPRLNVTTQRITPVDLPAFSFTSADASWETDFSLSQPLYTGGSVRKGVAAAKSYLRGSAGQHQRARQTVAFAVRESYYRVLTAEQQVEVSQEAVDSAKEHLRVAQLRYEAGVAPQFDVLAADARVARVEQTLIGDRTDLAVGWATLSNILGVPIPPGTELITEPTLSEVEAQELDGLLEEALARRPDLRAAEANAAAAHALLGAARAARQPYLSALMSYTLRESTTVPGESIGTPGVDLVVSQSSGRIALSATWSLYNAGQVEGEIATAKAGLAQARNLVESERQRIELAVRSAYVTLESAQAQVAAARKEVTQAEEARRIASLRYQEGVGTSVEILDAEANLEEAKTRLNSAVLGFNLAIGRLDLAVGRDWQGEAGAGGETESAGE